jgi:hypothetical protein
MTGVFRLGQQREAESNYSEGHVDCVISFLYLIDESEKVHNGTPNGIIEMDVDIPDRWG